MWVDQEFTHDLAFDGIRETKAGEYVVSFVQETAQDGTRCIDLTLSKEEMIAMIRSLRRTVGEY